MFEGKIIKKKSKTKGIAKKKTRRVNLHRKKY
jgi:hypothetical protein